MLFLSFAVILLTLCLTSGSFVAALWPQPRSLASGSTPLILSPTFDVNLAVTHPPSDLLAAVSRAKLFLANDKLERLVVGRGAADAAAVSRAKHLAALTVSLEGHKPVKSITEEIRAPLEERDEAYSLHVPADGSTAELSANTTLGLLRGLTTFGQMWYFHAGQLYTVEAPFEIEDSPTFVSAVQHLGFKTS